MPRAPEKRDAAEGEFWKEPEERTEEAGRQAFMGTVREERRIRSGIREKHPAGDRKMPQAVRTGKQRLSRLRESGKRQLPRRNAAQLDPSGKLRQRAVTAARQNLQRAGRGLSRLGQQLAAAVRKLKAAAKGLGRLAALAGTPAGMSVVLVLLAGLLLGSAFGIFFASEAPAGDGMTLSSAIRAINGEYQSSIDAILAENPHTAFVIEGDGAPWKEVLCVYAVKVTLDPENGQEVVTMNEEKEMLLREVFWNMTELSFSAEDGETDPGTGEPGRILTVRVFRKTAEEAAKEYGFSAEQVRQMREMLAMDASVWLSALYGIASSADWIVQVALSQEGNVGGRPYWSWYGFEERVAWCACFVSWCADQCGYLAAGVIPKYASCADAGDWFRERGQWADGSAEPLPGMIIFFDWDDPDGEAGPRDGHADHTGIVEKAEDGYVYTIEGNSSDRCRQRQYPLGSPKILGYGMPDYGRQGT